MKDRRASPESQHVDLLGEWAGETVSIFIAVGRDPALLRQRMDEAARRDAAGHLREAESADRAWLARTARVRTPEPSLNRLYTRALLNVRGNSFDTGVLIAGSDGWYKHAWIRDGGYTTMGLDLAGLHDEAERFYRYWLADAGFSYGGENECQQPAIGILGFLHHYHLTGDRQLLTDAWPYVERYADYYRGRIEREGMVHTAEEWINQIPAQTAWPNAEIYAGLVAAAEISMLLGKRREDDWLSAAVELRRAIRETAYDPMLGRFRPLSGKWTDDRVDSGMLNLARLGVFRPHVSACTPGDPAMTGTVAQIKRELQQADYAISRFTGNRRGYGYPTGQWAVWPISTAWMAQYHLLLGEPSAALLYLSAVARKQGYPYDAALWYLPEQMAITGQPVSTRNLAWSNGEFIASLLLLLTGYVPDHAAGRARLAPGLPLGWPEASVDNLELMGARISLRVQRQGQERTLSLTHGAGPAVRLQLRLPADALPDPEAIHVNGEPVAWKSDVGWIDLAGEWTLSSASPELTARWREPLAPPCGIAWDTLASASVAGLEDIPEAARLSATLTHLLGLPDDPQRPSIVFQPASLPPTQYRFPLVTEPASASGVVVEYGGPLGAKRAARRLVLEAERYGHRHRLPAQREANSDLQRHLGRRP
ncbi:hypothetical protein HS125_00860 [bacterium]|nr:hypothetical protein [bacterium]